VSIANKFRAGIPEIVQDCASIEEFLTHVSRLDARWRWIFEQLPRELNNRHVSDLDSAFRDLLEFDHWERLAASPSTLDKELEITLRRVKAAIKRIYAIPSHRPIMNKERDEKILQARKMNPSSSFAQLGIKVGLGPRGDKIVERVIKRAQERERVKLQRLLELLADLIAFQERRQQADTLDAGSPLSRD
jgi:hypothetical protein